MVKHLTYEDLIRRKFAQFKYKPRKGQVELINQILEAYIIENKRYVILSASTGTGKSLVALIVSECLQELKPQSQKQTSYIIAHTNTLLKQYDLSYNDEFDMIRVMGRNNYDCAVMLGTAENCIAKTGIRNLMQFCGDCEYARIKKEMKDVKHMLTNYAYLFTAARNSKDGLARRIITIFDEAHLLNEQFVSHLQITLTEEVLIKMYNYLLELEFPDENIIKTIFSCAEQIKNQKIPENNHRQFLKGINKLIEIITDFIRIELDYALKEENKKSFVNLNKKMSFFNDYAQKLDAFLNGTDIQYVADIKPNLIEVSPIFIQDFFKEIEFTDKYLFMSATIDEDYLNRTMKIPKEQMKFIQSPNIFDKENKTVVFCNHDFMNFEKMNSEGFINSINQKIFQILTEHLDERGIILTTNFKLSKQIGEFLKKKFKENKIDMQVIIHTSKKPLKDLLEEFKDTKKPTILLSPSIFEGVDLPNDESRFQIFVKAPFYSLGSKRIQFIANNYADIYQKMTVYRLIQGAGRSTRSEDDWCVNYFLDSHLTRLFFSEHNLWQNEFEVIR